MANIQVMVHFDKELLTKIDDEVIKQGKNRTSGRMFDRSAYINFALSEYLKLPIIVSISLTSFESTERLFLTELSYCSRFELNSLKSERAS
jgi:hypothetical protein